MTNSKEYRLETLIAVPMPKDCIDLIEQADPRIHVIYDPELMPEPRYTADRVGQPMEWTEAMDTKWRGHLARAEVLLGFDRRNMKNLHEVAPNLRFIQGTSTGIGPVVKNMGYVEQGIEVASASGIHAVPIAEFQMMAMLAFTKDIFHLFDLKGKKQFERYCTGQLMGKTLGIIGLGKNGTAAAQRARAMGLRVLGIKRVAEGANPAVYGVDAIYPKEQIDDMLGQCDFVALTLPTTPETKGLMNEERFRAMKPGSVLINNSLGSTVVEPDLIKALEDGHLRGAALDVFATEPLPKDSPLWDMEHVLFSPHSASCAEYEDINMTRLFIDNLRRYLDGMPLRNRIDPELGY